MVIDPQDPLARRVPVLEARQLRLRAGDRLLDQTLNFALQPGQCWGLLGPNGVGKTSLLHTLAGLRPPAAGTVRLLGQELSSWGRRQLAQVLGLLLQDQEPRFPLPVLDWVLAGRYPHLGPWDWPGAEDQRLALAALEQVGLTELAQRDMQTLSSGERQRVAIATLLAQGPRFLLLDEPVEHLDLREQVRILDLVRRLRDQGTAILMSLHDPNFALRACDHLILLDEHRGTCGPALEVGTTDALSRLYGISLGMLSGPHGPILVPGQGR